MLRDISLRYDQNKAPFMGHALHDLLLEHASTSGWEFSGSFSFSTQAEFEALNFIDTNAPEDMREIDPQTGEPGNKYSYEQVKSMLDAAGITWAAIQAEHIENLDEYEQAANKRVRALEYPDWRDQLDDIYHAIDDGLLGESAKTSAFYTKIKAIKDRNP
jgi:hypothetical protein